MAPNIGAPSIVFTADLHFDETGAWKYRGITGDAQHSFKQIVNFCCEHKAGVLALGGDILDKPNPRPETIKFLCEQFDKLQYNSVPVVYIFGQHDGRQDWPSIHSWPIHLHGQVFDVDDFVICGFDYMRPTEFMATYARLQALRWQVFCSVIRCGRSSWATCARPSYRWLRLPFAMDLLTGDFHGHRVIKYAAADGSTGTVFSPGSTHVRDVAEEEEKRFFAIYKGTLTPYAYESITLDTRPVRRYKLATVDDADKFLAKLNELPLDGEGVKRAVIDVSYYDDIDGLGAELARLLENRCHLFLRHKSRRQDERAPSADARRAVADRGLAGAAGLVCEPGPVLDSSVRLLEAADPRLELEAMQAEFYSTPIAETQEVA